MPDYGREYGRDYSALEPDEEHDAARGYAMGTVRTGASGSHAGVQSARSGVTASRHVAHSMTGIARRSSTGYLNERAGVRRFNRRSSPFKTAETSGPDKTKGKGRGVRGYVPPYAVGNPVEDNPRANGGEKRTGIGTGVAGSDSHAHTGGPARRSYATDRGRSGAAGDRAYQSFRVPGYVSRPARDSSRGAATPIASRYAAPAASAGTVHQSRSGVHAPARPLASGSLRVAGSGQAIAGMLASGNAREPGFAHALQSRGGARMGLHALAGVPSGLARVGGTAWAQRERLMPADGNDQTTSISSQAVRFGRGGVRATGARAWRATRFAFRHRRQIMGGARATGRGIKLAATGAQRAALAISQLAARAVRAVTTVVTQVAAAATTALGLPVLVIIAVVLVIVLMFTSLFSADSTQTGVQNVPSEYEGDVLRAGSLCAEVTPALIAAQIEVESNWNPNATSPAGAQGIAQFMPSTWASHGLDGDGDDKADVWNPHDAIYSQGVYMCELAQSVDDALDARRIDGNRTDLILAAYNSGLGNVLKYGGVPPFSETVEYVQHIKTLIEKYAAEGGSMGGFEVGDLKDKPLVLGGDGYRVDIAAMGIPAVGTSYPLYQCTWWASVRRAQIGKPVDAYMGNGGQWDDSARRLGYPTGRDARAGDVIVFEPGVLGADSTYGHVAVVEKVNADGSIMISEANVLPNTVTIRTISAAQLAGGGVTFIH